MKTKEKQISIKGLVRFLKQHNFKKEYAHYPKYVLFDTSGRTIFEVRLKEYSPTLGEMRVYDNEAIEITDFHDNYNTLRTIIKQLLIDRVNENLRLYYEKEVACRK